MEKTFSTRASIITQHQGLIVMPPKSAKISVNLNSLGFTGACTITDLWTGKAMGNFNGEFAPEINRHGARLNKIAKVKKLE